MKKSYKTLNFCMDTNNLKFVCIIITIIIHNSDILKNLF